MCENGFFITIDYEEEEPEEGLSSHQDNAIVAD
jgi:hypothetical protein